MTPRTVEKLPFPEVIDNTFREGFTQCHQKHFWQAIQRLTSDVPNIHLHAGKSFAKALETTRKAFYEDNLSSTQAVAIGHQALIDAYGNFDEEHGYLDHAKSCANMLRAFEDYFFEYSLDHDTIVPITTSDGKRGIEFSFAIPTNINHPTTGNPILYAGRFDMLGTDGDILWVVDEKTSGQLGQSWSSQWDLNSQFTGYCMAARHYGLPVAGAIIRGVGLLKTKITHQQAIIYRPDWMIERWWNQLHRDLRMMIALWEADPGDGSEYDFALGGACTNYGNCLYKKLCISNDPHAWAQVGFRKNEWSPLAGFND
jgi:hypothetical protein